MKLLESIKVGNIEFKNRIMFPPLTSVSQKAVSDI